MIQLSTNSFSKCLVIWLYSFVKWLLTFSLTLKTVNVLQIYFTISKGDINKCNANTEINNNY